VKALLLAVCLALCATAFAQKTETPLDARLKKLEETLRCLVCQNQSLADSNAPLAEDLRREVRALAVAGKSDEEIKQFLVARYGDFVLYDPPVKRITWGLWFGPFVLLLGGALIWWLVLRRRRAARADEEEFREPGGGETPDEAVEKARELLDRPEE
jgi:cytochrome c-type biogenesis protein CcmH